MSKAIGSSTRRKVKRNTVSFVYNNTLGRFFKYVLTKRGNWMMENNHSAPRLSKFQMNKLKNN